jgi:hypothetical protein
VLAQIANPVHALLVSRQDQLDLGINQGGGHGQANGGATTANLSKQGSLSQRQKKEAAR